MKTLNKVQLIGRAGGIPEMRYTASGKAVAQLSLATDNYEGRDEQGNARTSTEWHNLVLWERLAEIATSYVQKGQLVYIEGRLRSRSWEDETGTKRNRTEVVVDDLILLGGNKPLLAAADDEQYAGEPEAQPAACTYVQRGGGEWLAGVHPQREGHHQPCRVRAGEAAGWGRTAVCHPACRAKLGGGVCR